MSGEIGNPQAEPGIGRSLERARENLGLSLRQVEQETRIRSRYLRDLEREDFDVLPAVYVLGSLKTYADFLGLDGAALSRQLKDRLVEPAGPDISAQLAALGDPQDDAYEADPMPAVGFDQLFVGMGVVLISVLAVMTLVATVVRGDESPVSQIDEPSTPEIPSEIALAGNVQEAAYPQPRRANDAPDAEGNGGKGKEDENGGGIRDKNKAAGPDKEPEAPKNGEDGRGQDAPESASFFDGVESAPVSPSPATEPGATASATASATATASAASAPPPANSAPSSPAPATDAPAATAPTSAPPAAEAIPDPGASPDQAPAAPVARSGASVSSAPSSPAPSTAEPRAAESGASPAPADTGASSPAPFDGGPDAPSRLGGGEERATAPPVSAAPPETEGGGEGSSPQPEAAGAGRISAGVDRRIDETFGEMGVDR